MSGEWQCPRCGLEHDGHDLAGKSEHQYECFLGAIERIAELEAALDGVAGEIQMADELTDLNAIPARIYKLLGYSELAVHAALPPPKEQDK